MNIHNNEAGRRVCSYNIIICSLSFKLLSAQLTINKYFYVTQPISRCSVCFISAQIVRKNMQFYHQTKQNV